jgi:hypothetical protein
MNENEAAVNAVLTTIDASENAGSAEEIGLPAHLVGLSDDEWAMWRCVCVRGAGFPAHQALALAAPECATAADRLIQAENEARCTKTETGCEHLSAAQECYQQAFLTATLQTSQAIHQIARSEQFREAVTWQNRHAIHSGIDALLRHTPEETSRQSKQRGNEALVANYLQRYATKNDTIGFFGPVGCARLAPSGEAIAIHPGSRLLASRTVYFEGWCIDALAETLARDKELWPWFVPRLMPHVRLEGERLVVPFAKPLTLSRQQARVLQACDGLRTAREIAMELVADPTSGLESEAEVYSVLEQLSAAKRILWTLEVLPEGAYPERTLRQLLNRIGDERLRRQCLDKLDALEDARDAIARAAGHPEQLDEAMCNLETVFVELTGLAPTRSGGKTYAARTLVYEDCRRDVEIELGPELLQTLGEPLSLFLISARWFTYHVAAFYYQAFMEAYAELAQQSSSPVVDFASFWLWVQPLLFNDDERLVDALVPLFQERWAQVFGLVYEDGQTRVHFSSEELRPRVLAAFDAPGPGWRAACYHSPDVLIRASNPEAIRAGDYQLIMGEFHIAMNTLQILTFLMQYPEPQEILSNTIVDLPEPRVLPIFSKQYLPLTRVRPILTTAKDFRLVYAPDACPDPHARVLPLGALVIEQVDERLVVRTRDGDCQFDVIEIFAEFLSRLVVGCFKLFPPKKHRPRITIDRMVVAREAWSFAPSEIAFATEKTPASRFLAARRWAQEQHMPRFVFVKVASEQKPCFIDFDSPIYVDIFAKLIRRDMERGAHDISITVSEMLPEPDQTWLPDAEGNQYTSELRFVAVDLLLPYEEV